MISFVLPPKIEDLSRTEINVHYLGYYLKWTPQSLLLCSGNTNFKARPFRTQGTYSKYAVLMTK